MIPFAALAALVIPVAAQKNGNLVFPHTYVVGAVGLALASVGLCRRRTWPLLPLAVAAFCTALGYALGPWGPFALLRRLPLYSALRYPERYLIVVALFIAVSAANGVRKLEILARRHAWARKVVVLSVVLLTANAGYLLIDFHVVAAARSLVPAPIEVSRPFRQARGNRWLAAFYAPMSRGSLSCWDAYPVPMSPLLRGDLPEEEYLLDPGAGSVTRRHWTPNTIDLDVTLSRPTELLVNQNFHTGWRSNVGHVRSHDGLLAVALPPGIQSVRLSFRPRSAIAGAISSLVACLIACCIIGRERRRSRINAVQSLEAHWLIVAAVLPLALFAIIYGLISESRPVSAPLRAPSGEEVLAPRVSADSVGIGAIFGRGIVLDAVRPPAAAAVVPGDPSTIEIDWRVTGTSPRDTDIVVSFESGARVLTRADHELVSAALRFTDAPRGVTLRDMVPFVIPPAASTGSIDVWVGVRDGGSHRPLRPSVAGRATRGDGRVLVITLDPFVSAGESGSE
jgi:hypothetical protein